MVKSKKFCIHCGSPKKTDGEYCQECLDEFIEHPFQEEHVIEPAEIKKKPNLKKIFIPIAATILVGIIAFSIVVAVDYTNSSGKELELHLPFGYTVSGTTITSLSLLYDVTDTDIKLDKLVIRETQTNNVLQRFDVSGITPSKLINNTINLFTSFSGNTFVLLILTYKPGNFFSFGSESSVEAYFWIPDF